MQKQFKNQHRTLESFGYNFLVICPNCSKYASVNAPFGEHLPIIQNVTKRFLCTHCGWTKDLIPKKKPSQSKPYLL